MEIIQMKRLFSTPTTLAAFLSLQSFPFCLSQNLNSSSLLGKKRGSLWLPLEVLFANNSRVPKTQTDFFHSLL